MNSLIEQVTRIREKSREFGNTLGKELSGKTVQNDPRTGCFAMIFDKAAMGLDVLIHFREQWSKPGQYDPEAVQLLKKQSWERCIEFTKLLFVGTVSVIEYCAKESIKLYPNSPVTTQIDLMIRRKIARKRRPIYYLSDVIRESNRCGLIPQSAKDKWDRIIWLRNIMVHNNGVADSDDVYVIDGLSVTLEKGKMLQGKIDCFTNLTESSVENYNSWITALVNS